MDEDDISATQLVERMVEKQAPHLCLYPPPSQCARPALTVQTAAFQQDASHLPAQPAVCLCLALIAP